MIILDIRVLIENILFFVIAYYCFILLQDYLFFSFSNFILFIRIKSDFFNLNTKYSCICKLD